MEEKSKVKTIHQQGIREAEQRDERRLRWELLAVITSMPMQTLQGHTDRQAGRPRESKACYSYAVVRGKKFNTEL